MQTKIPRAVPESTVGASLHTGRQAPDDDGDCGGQEPGAGYQAGLEKKKADYGGGSENHNELSMSLEIICFIPCIFARASSRSRSKAFPVLVTGT
jgi:hypothetical protein